MHYLLIQLETAPEHRERLLAICSELPFDSFLETESGFEAALPEGDFSPELQAQLERWSQELPFRYRCSRLEARNWNAEWERSFQPVRVSDFVGVRASFHPPIEGVRHELVIDPRMAFGTGHHETTHMMLELMAGLEGKGKSVLDFGCGTGVLAILARRLGANPVHALDNDPAAVENTRDNCQTNHTPGIQTFEGTIADLPPHTYDLILANINRGVILDALPELEQRLRPGGQALLSGFLLTDEPLLLKAVPEDWNLLRSLQRNEWLALLFQSRD